MFFISISIVLVRYSIWWSLLILPSFISKYLYLDKQFGEKKTYIINYLDDVYYSCDASKLSRKRSFIFYIASLIMHILVFLSTLYSFSKSSEEKYLLVVIFLLILISAGIGILGLLDYIGKYKNKMYHYEFDLYKRGITLVCSSLTLFGFAITLINFDILNHIFLIVLLLIMCILSFIHLHFVCVNYKTYVLVYEDENGKIEQLFKK
jgi:hypothetical protein